MGYEKAIGTVAIRLKGRVVILFHMKHSGARMPLITSHMNTPCFPANLTGLECGLAAMAGFTGEAP